MYSYRIVVKSKQRSILFAKNQITTVGKSIFQMGKPPLAMGCAPPFQKCVWAWAREREGERAGGKGERVGGGEREGGREKGWGEGRGKEGGRKGGGRGEGRREGERVGGGKEGGRKGGGREGGREKGWGEGRREGERVGGGKEGGRKGGGKGSRGILERNNLIIDTYGPSSQLPHHSSIPSFLSLPFPSMQVAEPHSRKESPQNKQ